MMGSLPILEILLLEKTIVWQKSAGPPRSKETKRFQDKALGQPWPSAAIAQEETPES